jgi:hypothetical protein
MSAGARTGIAEVVLAADNGWAAPFSDAIALLMLAGAAVFFYMGISQARARWFLRWLADNLRGPAVFWGLLGLLSMAATVTATVLQAREVFLEFRKPAPSQDVWLHALLLIFLVGSVFAAWKTLTNARRMYAAGAAPRADRLRVLNPLSTLRTAEKLSSPSGRYLVFIFSLFVTAKFWLGSIGVYLQSEPAGSNVFPHIASMSLFALALCAYARSSRRLTSAASTLTGISLRIIGTAGCILALSLWTSSLLLFIFKAHAPEWWIYGYYGPLGMVLAGRAYDAGQDVLRFSRRHLTKIIRDPAQLDRESFGLYLRSFPKDALQATPQRLPLRGLMPLVRLFVTGRSEEEQIAAALKRSVGPLIAVGTPGEVLPYVGASRMYLPLDDWQGPVRRLLAQARMVVLSLGPSEGTMWELREAMRTVPPERLVLLVPMARDEYEEFRLHAEVDFEDHDVRVRPRGSTETLVPVLPRSTSRGTMQSVVQGLIYFSPEWTAEYVNLEDLALASSVFFDRLPWALKAGLRPVVRQLAAYEFDPDHPTDVPQSDRRSGLRFATTAFVIAVVVLGVGLWSPWPIVENTSSTPATSQLWSESISDDAPAGRCIASQDSWNGDKTKVLTVDCNQPHWGEVLGYPTLGAVPSPYPGDDQVAALANFECVQLRAQRGLPADTYVTAEVLPPASSWNNGTGHYENYTTCVVHRIDGRPMTTKVTSPPGVPQAANAPVPLDLYSGAIYANAPVGTCIQHPVDVHGEAAHAAPIVRCTQPHWAELLGYPILYQPGQPWPGDDQVYAMAVSACQNVAARRAVPPGFTTEVVWPGQVWWSSPKYQLYATCLAVQQ